MKKTYTIFLFAVLLTFMLATVSLAQSSTDLEQATANIETAIQDAMSRSGQSGQPTLGQLGGVEGGSTDSDASGGAGGESSGGGGSGGGGGCFAPDTLVLMADGSSKRIVDIKVGDKVASWDFATNAQTSATVLHLYTVQRDHSYLVDGISVTAEHPFCTAPGQFTEVQFLKKGSKVADVSSDGLRFIPVKKLVKVDEGGTFHNMTVDGSHTFIVSPATEDGAPVPFDLSTTKAEEAGAYDQVKREREDISSTTRAAEASAQQGRQNVVHNKSGSSP